jgi:hypothetical protein
MEEVSVLMAFKFGSGETTKDCGGDFVTDCFCWKAIAVSVEGFGRGEAQWRTRTRSPKRKSYT